MYWEDENFMHERIKRLSENAPAPRKDEIKRLQSVLTEQARNMDRRVKMRRRASMTIQAAAFLALAVWSASLAFPSLPGEAPSQLEQTLVPSEMVEAPFVSENYSIGPKKNEPLSTESKKSLNQEKKRSKETGNEIVKGGFSSTTETTSPAFDAETGGNAKEMAAIYLEQLIGAEKPHYELVESLIDPKRSEYVFVRKVNGLPFLNDHYIVGLDEQNKGKSIVSNQIQGREWSERLFPDPSATIGKSEAEKILVQTMTPFFSQTQAAIYDPEWMGFIDARSGQLIGVDKRYDILRGKVYTLDSARKRWTVTTEDDAIQLLASEFGLAVEKTFRRSENDFLDTRSYRWRTGNDSAITLKTVSSTGEIVEMEYVGQPATGTSAQLNATTVTQTAVTFLQNYLAAEITDLQVIEVEQDKLAYRIYFQALSGQKDPASFPVYTVEVHAATGQVIWFQKNLVRKEQMPTKPTQHMQEAITAKEYADRHSLQLAYIWLKGQEAPSLVYVPLERSLLSGYIEEMK